MWKYYIFSLSQLCWGGILFSPIPPCLPLAYSHSSGVNDTEEWIQRACVLGGGVWGWKWTTLIKHIGLISGCGIAAYQREQVRCRPTRFCLSSAEPPTPFFSPCASPMGGVWVSVSCWNDKSEVKQLFWLWREQNWCQSDSIVSRSWELSCAPRADGSLLSSVLFCSSSPRLIGYKSSPNPSLMDSETLSGFQNQVQ